ncbi:MAG: diacylglycerol kinase family protein [Eggerthellaceae bacterium]|nr:diacylglycerol kinase family protein [Eggerthellaceae bacterium]
MRALIRSFKCAAAGIVHAIKTQRNMRIHVFVAVCALLVSYLLELDPSEWGIILLCIGLVMAAECFNTAIEAVVDKVSPEVHPLAKHAKDCAAGAVLICALISIAAGLTIFVPALLEHVV